MSKSRFVLPLIILAFLSVNVIPVFATTETFSILPDQQKSFDIILQENQKIYFQIFVSGGENNDVRLKIIDKNSDYEHFNSIIREHKEEPEFGSPEFPAYKNEISNEEANPKELIFIFDNSLSSSNSKNIDFTYAILKDSDAFFEQTGFWSGINSLLIIVLGITLSIIFIIIISKKLKKRK